MRLITKLTITIIKALLLGYKLANTKSRKALIKKKLGSVEKQILNWV